MCGHVYIYVLNNGNDIKRRQQKCVLGGKMLIDFYFFLTHFSQRPLLKIKIFYRRTLSIKLTLPSLYCSPPLFPCFAYLNTKFHVIIHLAFLRNFQKSVHVSQPLPIFFRFCVFFCQNRTTPLGNYVL